MENAACLPNSVEAEWAVLLEHAAGACEVPAVEALAVVPLPGDAT